MYKALVMIVEKHRVCKFFLILEYSQSHNCRYAIWFYRATIFHSNNSEVLVAVIVEVAADK